MHILFLTDNFPPETNAPASRTYEHARLWVSRGNKVTVITCAPNFPQGKVYSGYKNAWFSREDIDGIDVWRVKTYITANEGFFKRTLDFISYMLASFFAGFFVSRPDVVVATSPQFFTAIGGWALSAIRNKPFVFEVRDIWPEQIAAVGKLRRDSVFFRLLERLELFLYRRSAAVVVVTNAYKTNLVSRGIDSNKIYIVTNGIDLRMYKPLPKDEGLVSKYGLMGKFVIGYIGTMGESQGLENAIDAAELLMAHGRNDIAFLFVGGGAERVFLEKSAVSRGLKNVIFIPAQPKEEIARYWSVCDAALVHLRNLSLFQKVIPSKMFEAMGMKLPVVLVAPDGECASIVRDLNTGLHVPAGSPPDLEAAIVRLCDNKDERDKFSQNSVAHAPKFDRDLLAESLLDVFVKVARGL